MDLGAPSSSSLIGSLRGFLDSFFGSVHDRFELLSIELQEEKQRLQQTFVWLAAFVFCAGLGILFASGALVVACWDTAARIPVVIGLALLYLGGAVFTGLKLRDSLAHQPRPFAATLEEVRSDRACLQPKD